MSAAARNPSGRPASCQQRRRKVQLVPASATALVVAAARSGGHQGASTAVFIVIILFAVLYIAWRAGWLRGPAGGSRLRAWRADLREIRVSPLALVPMLLLVAVVVILLLGH